MSQLELIRVTERGAATTVSFSSEHINQMETARQIGWQLTELIGNGGTANNIEDRLHLDFKDIHRITSAGLNELIGINSQARSNGVRLVLVDVPPSVRDVFALTRLERMFEFCSSTVNA